MELLWKNDIQKKIWLNVNEGETRQGVEGGFHDSWKAQKNLWIQTWWDPVSYKMLPEIFLSIVWMHLCFPWCCLHSWIGFEHLPTQPTSSGWLLNQLLGLQGSLTLIKVNWLTKHCGSQGEAVLSRDLEEGKDLFPKEIWSDHCQEKWIQVKQKQQMLWYYLFWIPHFLPLSRRLPSGLPEAPPPAIFLPSLQWTM